MMWRDRFVLAVESLRVHRLRTRLTLAAIAIGVLAVILLTALGDAAKRYIVDEFASIGTNLVIVAPGKVETSGIPGIEGSTRDLTLEDCEALLHRAPAVAGLCPVALGSAPVSHAGRVRTVYVTGATAGFARMRGLTVSSGRFLPEGELDQGAGVAVIGSRIQRELFPGTNPVGQAVRIAGWRFRVIGVLESRGRSLGVDFDEIALVPVATAMRLFDQRGLHRIVVQAHDPAAVGTAVRQVKAVLRERHDGEEDFTVITQDAMLATFDRVIHALTMALADIAAISLAVAGIGIMNVMLVSVSERTSEVGLLKALGARRRQILGVFLTEAVLLSAMGAGVGVATGVAVILIAARVWQALPLEPSLAWVIVVTTMALACGAMFGLLPARRAAALPAADALRGKR